jgi:hypothetical protein
MIADPDMAIAEGFAEFVDWLHGHAARGPDEVLTSLPDARDRDELAQLMQLAFCLNAAVDAQRNRHGSN